MDFNEPIWIGSPHDVRIGPAAAEALLSVNDSEFVGSDGVVRVSHDRWQAAQRFEWATWMQHMRAAASDRNDEHAYHFDGYRSLPADLGNVLEVGCGPFTQLRTILGAGHIATSITLVDPLAADYINHPNCAYRDQHLAGIPAAIVTSRMEEFCQRDCFDTIICINVLEHVQDAVMVMQKLYAALRPGGLLIFHDRTWDGSHTTRLYDVGHPIRLKMSCLSTFLASYDQLYRNDSDFSSVGTNVYLIGRKA